MSVTPTDRPYQIPLHVDFEAFVEDSLTVMRGPRIEVELIFEKRTAAWANDRVWHPSQQLTRVPDGKLRMTMTIADSRELVGWILSFGSGVRVVRSNDLRVAVVKRSTLFYEGTPAQRYENDRRDAGRYRRTPGIFLKWVSRLYTGQWCSIAKAAMIRSDSGKVTSFRSSCAERSPVCDQVD